MIHLALETDLRQLFWQTFSPFDHDGSKRCLAHPHTVVGFSDSGAHVSQMSDASIETHLLGHWVRNCQEFSLEEAVRMLTLEPARGATASRPGSRARRPRGRPQRVRPGDRRTRHARARPRPARRRTAHVAAVGRLPRHPGRRRDPHRPRRSPPRLAPDAWSAGDSHGEEALQRRRPHHRAGRRLVDTGAAKYRERAPHVVEEDGREYWVYEDERTPTMGLNAVAGKPRRTGTPSRCASAT